MGVLEDFREETRVWLQENCPESMRLSESEEEMIGGGTKQEYKNPDAKVWLDRMASRGWTAPMWPMEYTGARVKRE